MTVKKALFLTAAAAVVTLASISAYAARPAQPISESWSLECGLIRVSPPDRDRDPGFKINISISPEEGFVVTHTMISGAVYDRTDQYEDLRSWKVNNGPYQWSGRSVKYPQLVMLGTFGRDRTGQLVYMEEIYRSGRLETTVRSTCHLRINNRSTALEGARANAHASGCDLIVDFARNHCRASRS
jgi:hypothetical protein